MIQWIGIGITIIGMLVSGYQQYQQQNLTIPQSVVQYPQQQMLQNTQQPIRYYQAAFDPNTGKIYFLNPDGKWYEQVPQIRTDQTQHSSAVGVGQGSQSAPLGQRPAQQQAQTAPNPWFR